MRKLRLRSRSRGHRDVTGGTRYIVLEPAAFAAIWSGVTNVIAVSAVCVGITLFIATHLSLLCRIATGVFWVAIEPTVVVVTDVVRVGSGTL